MEWALRKKGLAEVLVQAVMSLYEGSRTKVSWIRDIGRIVGTG